VHHSLIHTKIANKMQQCIIIYYSMFIWSSTCFGRHTAHHQELNTALAASGFAYVKGCWTLRLLDAVSEFDISDSSTTLREPQTPISKICFASQWTRPYLLRSPTYHSSVQVSPSLLTVQHELDVVHGRHSLNTSLFQASTVPDYVSHTHNQLWLRSIYCVPPSASPCI